MNNRTR